MRGKVLKILIHPAIKLYWFIFRPKTCGVKCIIQNGKEILMIRNSSGPSVWTFPGGVVKKGETVERTVQREVKEEVGIEIYNLKPIGEFQSVQEYKKDTVKIFAAQSSSKTLKINPYEILEARWFAVDQLPTISEYAKKIISLWNQKNINK